MNWRGWGFELQDVSSEDLHILQKSSLNLLRSIPRNLLRENQRSFCWIPPFLQNVKKRTQNYAYSVSALINCASIIFGIIRHHEHNFRLFHKTSTANILLANFAAQNCHLNNATNFFGPRVVLQASLSKRSIILSPPHNKHTS